MEQIVMTEEIKLDITGLNPMKKDAVHEFTPETYPNAYKAAYDVAYKAAYDKAFLEYEKSDQYKEDYKIAETKWLATTSRLESDFVFEPDFNFTAKYTEPKLPVFEIKQFSNSQETTLKAMMEKESISQKSTELKAMSMLTKDSTVQADSLFDEDKYISDNGKYMGFVHSILIGWTGVKYSDGTEMKYDGTIETMLELPEPVLTDVLHEAMKITGFFLGA